MRHQGSTRSKGFPSRLGGGDALLKLIGNFSHRADVLLLLNSLHWAGNPNADHQATPTAQ